MGELIIKVFGVNTVNIATLGIAGVATLLFGSWMPLMTAFLVLQVCDVITGLMKGTKGKRLGSTSFFVGIKKKGGMWVLVILANVIDGIAFGGLPVAKTGVLSFLLAGEGISITENLAAIGLPIPKFITDYLSQLKEQSDNTDITNKKENADEE